MLVLVMWVLSEAQVNTGFSDVGIWILWAVVGICAAIIICGIYIAFEDSDVVPFIGSVAIAGIVIGFTLYMCNYARTVRIKDRREFIALEETYHIEIINYDDGVLEFRYSGRRCTAETKRIGGKAVILKETILCEDPELLDDLE